MRLSNKSFFLHPIIFYFVMLIFMRPDCITDLAPAIIVSILKGCDKFFGIPIIAICLIMLVKDSRCLLYDVISYYSYKIISTIIITFLLVGTITGGGAFKHLWTLSAVLYVSIALKLDFTRTVSRLTYIFAFLVFSNFLTIILFPGGMYYKVNYENYFLGYDNGHMVVFMPALFFSFEHAFRRRRFILTTLIWLAVIISVIICRSGTTILGVFALLFMIFFIHFRFIRRYIFNWKTVSVLIVCIFLFVVVFRKQMDFSELIMFIFHKDTTLTGRTILWDRAFSYIKLNPIFGTGDNESTNWNLFQLNSQQLSYAHNEILDILVRSGFLGLALYINCILVSFKNSRFKKNKETLTWLAFVSSYWIAMMFESYSNYSFYFFYFVMIIAPRFMFDEYSDQNCICQNTNDLRLVDE